MKHNLTAALVISALTFAGGSMVAYAGGHIDEAIKHAEDAATHGKAGGVIAGRVPLGLGAMLGHLDGEHDGTVTVAETELPGVADHCVVEANHTGLLFSQEVARQTTAFLQHGHFAPPVD